MDSELDFSGASISEIVPGEHDGGEMFWAQFRCPELPYLELTAAYQLICYQVNNVVNLNGSQP